MARARLRRLGKFNRIVNPGLHFLIPFIERRAANINLRTQEARYLLNGKTKDNVTIGTAVSVQFRVDQMPAQSVAQSGVYRSYYILSNPIDQMESYIADAPRSAIPGYTLDEVFDNKDLIAQNVKDSVTELMAGYGYDIITTLITNIELPKDVERSMNAINSAQRDQEAAKALAEAERTKTVVAARAQAEAMEQTGIGIANQRKAIADGIAASLDTIKSSGVSAQEANDLFAYTQWVEMMGSFAESGRSSTVVFRPISGASPRSFLTSLPLKPPRVRRASLRRKSGVSLSYPTEYASLRPEARVRSGAASTRSGLIFIVSRTLAA